MDSQIVQTVNDFMSRTGVTGVSFIDKNGLSVCSKGKSNSESAGFIHGLATRAKELTNSDHPIITIETDASTIHIKTEGDYTFALFRDA